MPVTAIHHVTQCDIFFNTTRDGDSTTSPCSLYQCVTALSEKKFFLIPKLTPDNLQNHLVPLIFWRGLSPRGTKFLQPSSAKCCHIQHVTDSQPYPCKEVVSFRFSSLSFPFLQCRSHVEFPAFPLKLNICVSCGHHTPQLQNQPSSSQELSCPSPAQKAAF